MSAAGEAAFRTALTFTLAREGCDLAHGDTGYVDDPADPGGATNYGITQGTYDAWRNTRMLLSQPVRAITLDEASVIYERNYWHDGRCDLFADTHPQLALAHFDASVNQGLVPAARVLQRAAYVTDDGMIGPATLAAIAAASDDALVARQLCERTALYRAIVAARPASQKFLAGWLARCRWVARQCGVPVDVSYAGLA